MIPDIADLLWTGVEVPFGKSSWMDVTLATGGVVSTVAPVVGDGAAAGAKITSRLLRAEKNVAKGSIHHICTNKNCVSAVTGGPWTPRFEAIFDKAGGMKLEDALNKIAVPGHKGPHPEAYHQAVFDRLTGATNGLNGSAYRDALQNELRAIGREIQSPGSVLNSLVTKP